MNNENHGSWRGEELVEDLILNVGTLGAVDVSALELVWISGVQDEKVVDLVAVLAVDELDESVGADRGEITMFGGAESRQHVTAAQISH